jgi:chemotaxis protein methyltransferase CheR
MHLSHATFDRLRQVVYQHCGLVVPDDKEYLIRDRLGAVVKERSLRNFDDLCDRLLRGSDPSLLESVIDSVTTQETSFFRDAHVFDALTTDVIPNLAASSGAAHGRLRIWSAGVSTGQEAYSLAILAQEFVAGWRNASGPDTKFSILGSDISAAALRIAQAGVYEAREMSRGLSPARVQQYFEDTGGTCRVRESTRRLVEFRRINLAESFTSLGSFDLICCRNVLIYFDQPTRQRICRQFHAMLAEGGRLLLGSAENLYGIFDDFVSLPLGKALIYRKV